jgi:hypothetical protein
MALKQVAVFAALLIGLTYGALKSAVSDMEESKKVELVQDENYIFELGVHNHQEFL